MSQRIFRALIAAFVLLLSLGAAQLDQGQQPSAPTLKGAKTSATSLTLPAATTTEEQQISEGDVVRVDANLVTVPAAVMDRNGRYVTNLRKEDFRIFEDGVEQQLAFFAPAEQSFTILLMLDTTSSMTAYRETLDRAAKVFVRLLHPDDQVIAGNFYQNDIELNLLVPATRVSALRKEIEPKIRREADCSTLIYDVVHDALRRMKQVPGRKAILLLSDGQGIGIFASAKSTLREAEEQDALIYTVQFGTYELKSPRSVSKKIYLERIEETNGYMIDLPRKTGGRHFHVDDISDMEKTFGLIVEELRRQYSLGYYPKSQLNFGERRKIKVKVDRPDLVVRAARQLRG